MPRTPVAVAVLVFMSMSMSISIAADPPATRRDNVTETLHGVKLTDPYRWLEDQNSPETRAWIEQQNRHTRAVLDSLDSREPLRRRISALHRVETMSAPGRRGNRYFFYRRKADQEQGVYLMRVGVQGPDKVLVDANQLAKDGMVSVSAMATSDDGRWFAYGIQQGGKDERAVRILETGTLAHLADALPEGKWGGFAFTRDKKKFYYTTYGSRDPRVREHVIGTPVTADRDIFGQGYSSEHILTCDISDDGRYLLILVYVGSSEDVTEVFYKDLREPGGPVRPVAEGVQAALIGEIVQGRYVAKTNWKAPNWRVVAIDLANSAPANWREIVPESKSVIETISLAAGRLFVNTLEDVHSRIRQYSLDGRLEREVALPSAGYASPIRGRWRDKEVYYSFESFHIPATIFRLDPATGRQTVWFRPEVPVDAAALELRQVWYSSKDGTRVPMFLLHKKGVRPTGGLPVLLTGYGGFNVSNTPEFTDYAVAWAEQGGVFALASLRGGGEFGEAWHRAGMLANKQNVFDDFIGAAEYLIREKYTSPKRLAIKGGSNGGLLVGAAMTQRPELFQAVLCTYPLLDMVRYHRFLVARFWVPEYGSSEDAGQFQYLQAYSPYHRVRPEVDYPATMIVTGDSDTRVDPLHGRKMAALLQSMPGRKRPVLLHYDTRAGHAGGVAATRHIDETADMLAFVASELGVPVR